MLVLSRVVGEQIIVGDDVVITVVEIRSNGKVRIGVSAPAHVRVDRKEIRDLPDYRADRKGTDE